MSYDKIINTEAKWNLQMNHVEFKMASWAQNDYYDIGLNINC